MSRLIARLLGSSLALATSFCAAAAFAAPPPAQLRYLDTDSATAGAFVGVYGVGFGEKTADSKVSVGAVAATEIALWSNNLIIFRVPAGAKSGTVSITPASGSSLASASSLTITTGSVYVVSPKGTDVGTAGSESEPFQTVHFALSQAKPGDTILIHSGTYKESDSSPNAPAFYLRPSISGEASKPITLRGYGAELPVLTGPGVGTASGSDSLVALAGSHLRLARLDLNASSSKADAISVLGSDIWLSGLKIHNFGSRGVFVADVSDVTIMGNTISDGGTVFPNDHGLYLTGKNLVVRDNEISGLRNGFGIMLAQQTQSKAVLFSNVVKNAASGGLGFDRVGGDNRVYNNVFANVGFDTLHGCHCGLQVAYGDSAGEVSSGDRVYYNTFYGPAETAVRVSDRNGKVYLNGNIFAQFASGLLVEDTVSTQALISSNNLWWAIGSSQLFRWGATIGTLAQFQSASKQETSSITGDPLFLGAKLFDFHLKLSSPAVDHGGGTDSVQVDLDGTSRSGQPDIGAYEATADLDGGVDGAVDGGDAAAVDGSADGAADASKDGASGDGSSDATLSDGAKTDGALDATADGSSDASSVPAPPAASDDSGCGCRVAGTASRGASVASLALVAMLALARRRRRSA